MSDAVRLRVAPWIALSREQESEDVYAVSYGDLNADLLEALSAVPIPTAYPTNQWAQDHVEIGYTQMPGGPKTHVTFRMPYDKNDVSANPIWPVFFLLGPNKGAFQIGREVCRIDEHFQDWGGNLEVLSRDATHNLGRIVMGEKDYENESGVNPSPALRQFIESQGMQDPFFEVPLHWFSVAHIDEVVSFLPDGRVAIADPKKGWDLLKNQIQGEDRGKSLFFDVKGGHEPVAGEITADSNINGTLLHVDEDYTGQTWWKYVRIYDGAAKGRVAEIAEGGLADHEITIVKVWETGSKIINAVPSIFYNAHGRPDAHIPSPNWGESPPQDGDKYVLCTGTLFWKKGTPAIVTLEEVLDDNDFEQLNRNDMHDRINGGGSQSIRNVVKNLYSGTPPLTFLKVPCLFFGNIGPIEIWEVSGSGFTPAPANLQQVAGKLFVPKQFAPRKDTLDVFETEIKNILGSDVEFVDDWFYHVDKGNVHCASSVKRNLDAVGPWWENQSDSSQ